MSTDNTSSAKSPADVPRNADAGAAENGTVDDRAAEDAPTASKPVQVQICRSIHEIGAQDWNACANASAIRAEAGIVESICEDGSPATDAHESKHEDSNPVESDSQEQESNPQQKGYNPFNSFEFLSCLEDSDCVGAAPGWYPHHLAVEDDDGAIIGVMPAYLKTNSFGEFVFDHGWADAYERAGGRYYPKLQVSIPFTPATGPRLLVRDPAKTNTRTTDAKTIDRVMTALISGAAELTRKASASSAHWTFLPEDEWKRLGGLGMLQRTDRQFHWFNRGYGTFDDFLGTLASRKRKTIRRERREALKGLDGNDISIEWITGSDLREHHWDAFHAFYEDTGMRKWGRPYLNREFFSLLGERMADNVLLVFANRQGQPIAGALNLIGSHALFGRHWGCAEDVPFLHFEVCYYQAIDFAIQHGLDRVEAGAQGEHKLARGYEPVTTYSAHHIPDPGFRDAVENYLQRERRYVDREIEALKDFTPFRKDC
jgi:predicted N-acyltransferase